MLAAGEASREPRFNLPRLCRALSPSPCSFEPMLIRAPAHSSPSRLRTFEALKLGEELVIVRVEAGHPDLAPHRILDLLRVLHAVLHLRTNRRAVRSGARERRVAAGGQHGEATRPTAEWARHKPCRPPDP